MSFWMNGDRCVTFGVWPKLASVTWIRLQKFKFLSRQVDQLVNLQDFLLEGLMVLQINLRNAHSSKIQLELWLLMKIAMNQTLPDFELRVSVLSTRVVHWRLHSSNHHLLWNSMYRWLLKSVEWRSTRKPRQFKRLWKKKWMAIGFTRVSLVSFSITFSLSKR